MNHRGTYRFTNQVDTQLMNIECSIVIPTGFEATGRTIVKSYKQGLRHNRITITALLRCAFWIHSNYCRASIFSFVRQHLNECTPRGIRNMFLKIIFIVFNHAFDFQIFIGNKVKGINEISRKFMLKIFSLISNFSVKMSKLFFNFLTFTFRIFTLNFFEFIFRLFQVFRIFNFSTITKNCKVGKPQVNSDSRGNNFLLNNYSRSLTHKNNMPLFSFSFNSTCFYFRAIRNSTMKFNFYKSYFGKFNPVVFNSKSTLRKTKRIISIKTFVSRETNLAVFYFNSLKKTFESQINSMKNILQNLTMYICILNEFLFQFWKFILLLFVRNRFMSNAICFSSMFQSNIVKFEARKQSVLQNLFLFRSWIYSELIRLHNTNIQIIITTTSKIHPTTLKG